MYLLILKSIEFRKRDDVQTVAYAREVPQWLGQWTVAANFNPYLMNGRDSHDIKSAANLIVQDHMEALDSALGQHVIRSKVSHANDFLFTYNVYVCEVGLSSKYVGCGSFIGGDMLPGGEPGE